MDTPCWVWRSSKTSGGYGLFYTDGGYAMAHRVAYVHFAGPIPTGYQIDHLCRVRDCVYWRHLEAVTPRENVRRGRAPAIMRIIGGAHLRAKTHCPKGHPYAGANLYVQPDGRRVCRSCAVAKTQRWRERQKLSA
jgi:hypothetical protein